MVAVWPKHVGQKPDPHRADDCQATEGGADRFSRKPHADTRVVPLAKVAPLSTVNAITIGSLIALISNKSGHRYDGMLLNCGGVPDYLECLVSDD
jgi:hypothetical protein